jgi:hypothetical protein
MNINSVTMKYVGFCKVLGLPSAILSNFEATFAIFDQFRNDTRNWLPHSRSRVSIYSESIIVVGNELPSVIRTIAALQWAALNHGQLIRGGVAYGRYFEESEDGDIFIVSDALVQAAAIQKSVKAPAVAISKDIHIDIEAWLPRFEFGVLNAPLLHFQELTIVNPFNAAWFTSAVHRVKQLVTDHPKYQDKYEWFLALADALARNDVLVPESVLLRIEELGIIKRREEPS